MATQNQVTQNEAFKPSGSVTRKACQPVLYAGVMPAQSVRAEGTRIRVSGALGEVFAIAETREYGAERRLRRHGGGGERRA